MRGRVVSTIESHNDRLKEKCPDSTVTIVDWYTESKSSMSKVKATCSIHGDGWEWGSPWTPTPHSLHSQGRSCPKCSGKYKATSEERITMINSQPDIEFVSWEGLYKGCYSVANLACTRCTHNWTVKIDKLSTGHRGCPQCGNRGWYSEKTFDKKPHLKDRSTDLYYIKFSKEGRPDYYKIGLDSTGHRWCSVFQGWNIEEVYRKRMPLYDAFTEEQDTLIKYAEYKGYPEEFQGVPGYTEMFEEDVWQTI